MMIPFSSEDKVLVTYYSPKLKRHVTDYWPKEQLWSYMAEAYRTGDDPLDLMTITQNEFALGSAEVYGMRDERKDKYGR